MLECSGSPKAPSTSRCALIDSSLALHELIERFGMGLVFHRVSQHAVTISTSCACRPLPAQRCSE